jgi:Taurine catabolism dioxygenase TauD, TfdA family
MTFQPPYRPSGRSVWVGKDLVRTDDWIVRLSPATLEEIDAAVSRLRGRNAYDTPVARDEFPLTTMAGELARMRHEIATGRGFFVFRGLDRDRYSNNDLGLIFRGFGAHFGHELTQSAFGDRLGDIRDISDILPERSKRRGYQSGGFQTAHTDPSGEVGIVAMLSLKMAMSGGESLIASAHTVHNMLLDWCPDLLGEFYQGFVLRRPEADAERMGRPPLIGSVPSFCYEDGWLNCDFQHGYMRRAVEHGDTTISPKQEAALGAFVAVSNHPDVMLKMMLEPGDFQFINNRTILHGRAEFEDHAAKEQRRHLYRLWLNVPEWPRMPASQSTLVAADMARWDAMAAQHRAATPAWAS